MAQLHQIPTWITTLLTALTLVLVLRIATADLPGIVVVRTYLFWALACAPVAYMGDILIRTVLEYRIVRLAVARVRTRR